MKSFLSSILIFLFILFSAVFGQDLKIYHLDVNQGDATLFVMPNGTSMLIDCGGDAQGDDVAKYIKDEIGLDHVDIFVASHYHSDHYGGVDKMIEAGIPVVFFYDRNAWNWLPDSKINENNFKQYKSVSLVKRKYLRPGYIIDLDPNVSIKCVVVNGKVHNSDKPIAPIEHENNHSIGLLISYNGFDYWTSGDLEEEVEEALVHQNVLSNVDVMKANHHGSATSSTRGFIEALDPEVVIISNGDHGGFQHPRQVTLNTISEALDTDVTIYQTNKLFKVGSVGGNVPDEFIADIDTPGNEGTILVTVSENQYEVSLVEKEVTRIFDIEN